jgi:hypothetical protein
MTRATDIQPEKIAWIWPGVLASSRVTGVVGFPGLGKSQVAIDLAAIVSTGRCWPGNTSNAERGDVIILAAEDDPADTIVPRLLAAGADRARVQIVKAVRKADGSQRAFNLATDLERLGMDHDLRQVRVVIIDPASAYLGEPQGRRINRNQGDDVRDVLQRLAAFASAHDLAVVTIAHLTKSRDAKAVTRVTGSVEWVAAPRAVFLVTDEVGTDRRLFLPIKNNLARDRLGYAFRIESRVVADGIETAAVRWELERVAITADEALVATAGKRNATSEAAAFLKKMLSDGPVEQTEIVRLGKEAGFTEKQLRTARENAGIKTHKVGFGGTGKWFWMPPGGAPENQSSNQTSADEHQR